jgi:hypothetical protein
MYVDEDLVTTDGTGKNEIDRMSRMSRYLLVVDCFGSSEISKSSDTKAKNSRKAIFSSK